MSSDLSLLVAIATPLAGLVVSGIWGRRRANARKPTTGGDALVNAIGLGILLTIAQNFLLAACMEGGLCTKRGDAGLSYVFQSFFATPVFWTAGWIAAKSKP